MKRLLNVPEHIDTRSIGETQIQLGERLSDAPANSAIPFAAKRRGMPCAFVIFNQQLYCGMRHRLELRAGSFDYGEVTGADPGQSDTKAISRSNRTDAMAEKRSTICRSPYFAERGANRCLLSVCEDAEF